MILLFGVGCQMLIIVLQIFIENFSLVELKIFGEYWNDYWVFGCLVVSFLISFVVLVVMFMMFCLFWLKMMWWNDGVVVLQMWMMVFFVLCRDLKVWVIRFLWVWVSIWMVMLFGMWLFLINLWMKLKLVLEVDGKVILICFRLICIRVLKNCIFFVVFIGLISDWLLLCRLELYQIGILVMVFDGQVWLGRLMVGNGWYFCEGFFNMFMGLIFWSWFLGWWGQVNVVMR